VGIAAMLLQHLVASDGWLPGAADAVAVVVLISNETTIWLFRRFDDVRRVTVANTQIALDTLALAVLLHLGGGIASPGIILFVPPFFVYGAVLPLGHVFAHVGAMMAQLAVLGALESFGVLAHVSAGFYPPEMYLR